MSHLKFNRSNEVNPVKKYVLATAIAIGSLVSTFSASAHAGYVRSPDAFERCRYSLQPRVCLSRTMFSEFKPHHYQRPQYRYQGPTVYTAPSRTHTNSNHLRRNAGGSVGGGYYYDNSTGISVGPGGVSY